MFMLADLVWLIPVLVMAVGGYLIVRHIRSNKNGKRHT